MAARHQDARLRRELGQGELGQKKLVEVPYSLSVRNRVQVVKDRAHGLQGASLKDIPNVFCRFLGHPAGCRSLLPQGLEVGEVFPPPQRSLVFHELLLAYEKYLLVAASSLGSGVPGLAPLHAVD